MNEATQKTSRWRLFGPDPARQEAEALVAAVSLAARRKDFYGPGRIADTLEGRLEGAILTACLALIRLKAAPDKARVAQLFVDVLFRQFDAGLRESGVGDLTVPRKMRTIASQFYGRLSAYSAGLAQRDQAALEAALTRNALPAADQAEFAAPLAAYALATAARLAEAPVDRLLGGEIWAAQIGAGAPA